MMERRRHREIGKRFSLLWCLSVLVVSSVFLVMRGQSPSVIDQDELWRHRTLGKAFYENPTTQLQAVEEFKKALDLAPDSARERLNYGLALLRAGKMTEGIAEMQKVQTQQPKMPHTWF